MYSVLMQISTFLPVNSSVSVVLINAIRFPFVDLIATAHPKDDCGHDDVRQRQRDEPPPPQIHQLVIPEARPHPAHPDEQQKKQKQLAQENANVCDALP